MVVIIRIRDTLTFNVFGTRDGEFFLQGSVTLAELMELRDQAQEAIDAFSKEGK